jgi:hypothetical protein
MNKEQLLNKLNVLEKEINALKSDVISPLGITDAMVKRITSEIVDSIENSGDEIIRECELSMQGNEVQVDNIIFNKVDLTMLVRRSIVDALEEFNLYTVD